MKRIMVLVAVSLMLSTVSFAQNDEVLAILDAEVYADEGDYDAAIREFNKVIERWPNSYLAYQERAAVYQTKGDYDQAISDITKCIELDPGYAAVYCHERARVYYHKQDYANAWNDVHKVEELGYADGIDQGFLADLKRASGRDN